VSDPYSTLSAALADRYRIERKLGQGGMAVVYLALDLKHHRQVALKILRPELTAALGQERFLREIETTAALHHPHILPLYDSGQAIVPPLRTAERESRKDSLTVAGGEVFLYYVMPYVEGESLRDRLTREQQLPLDDTLQITREVADALSYAHSRGIVHRDIKPENILLEQGHALVADFGIAKAVSAAGGEALTATGLAIGTAAYMSPEQWAAQAVDARSDLYSLACVTYEMLVGHGPFYGTTAHELRARHTSDPVPALRPARATVSVSMEHAITKALAKVPADRFSSVWAYAEALAAPAPPPPPPPHPWRRWAWPTAAVLGVAAVTAVLLLVLKGGTGAAAPPKIAVLPPTQLLGSAEDQQFAEGVTEEIADRLTNLSGLRVVSPRSATARQLATAGAAQRRLSDDVGVEFALQPSIFSERVTAGPRRVRVSLQLIRLADGTNLWAHSYTDTLTGGQIFDVQANIAEHVAQALNVSLLAGERATLQTKPTQNPAAYDAYLRGNAAARGGYGQAFSAVDRPRAVAAYRQAVALDSNFAEAHARLAIQYAALGRDSLAFQHAQRSLALDPNLPWGHLALAEYSFHDADWERFRTEAATAERLAPNSAEILEATATNYEFLDEWDHKLRNYEHALALDPLSWQVTLDLGETYFGMRRFAEAERFLNRASNMAPREPDPYLFKAWLYLSWHGSVPEARSVLQAAVQRLGLDSGFAVGFLRSGWQASRILARDPWYRATLERVSLGTRGLDSVSYYMHKAGLYEGLGETARARVYWDSTATVLEGRVRTRPPSKGPVLTRLLASLAVVHAAQGKSELALEEAGRAVATDPSTLSRAAILAYVNEELGHSEAAVAQFERLTELPAGPVTPQFLALDPTLAPLRAVPRFRALLEGH
jgi:serine/threonine protein kinase/tetratricopeptide (TPR) repeat protein